MELLKTIAEKLVEGQADEVKELTQTALTEGISTSDILDKGLIAGMTTIGKLFKEDEIFLPEVLIAAKAMDAGMKILEPLMLKSGQHKSKGKVALGTVKNDVHNIGKNLVAICLKGAGFEVIDLGTNVPTQKFVDAAMDGAEIIGMSALLTTTMQNMKLVVDELKKAGLHGKVKTIIGGCITTQNYADEIGADGYAPDAGSAVDLVKSLLKIT